MVMVGTRRQPGGLGPYVDGYRSRLVLLGYTSETTRGMLKVLGQLGRWMTVSESFLGIIQRGDSIRVIRAAIFHAPAETLLVEFRVDLVMLLVGRPRVNGDRTRPQFIYESH